MSEIRTKDINIMFLFHYTDMNNGAVRSMVDVIENLIVRYNVGITMVYPSERGSAVEYLEKMGVHCYHVRYGRLDYKLNGRFRERMLEISKLLVKNALGLWNIKEIGRIINLEGINLVYSNTAVINIGALISKKYGIPHVWHIREFGKEDHGIGFIFGIKRLYNWMNNATDAVIYISHSIKDKYKKYVKTKQYVIYNDISPVFVNPKKIYNLDCHKPLNVVIIGSIQEGKGQLEVIKAVEFLYERGIIVNLHVAGNTSGEYYKKIKKYVLEHDIQKIVSFDGFIRDTNDYRSMMDIGIVASSNEAFGRVTIEGMLSELAMIGADAAGTRELISDNDNGLLYELHNVEELANKLEWLSINRNEMKRIAKAGYMYALENFTKGNAADSIYKIITEIIK